MTSIRYLIPNKSTLPQLELTEVTNGSTKDHKLGVTHQIKAKSRNSRGCQKWNSILVFVPFISCLYQQYLLILYVQAVLFSYSFLTIAPRRFCCITFLDNMEGGKDKRRGKYETTVGPWGGNGGSNWDDGSYNGVREITLVYDRCIDSIRVLYDKKGKPFLAERHGGAGGNKTAEIKLQYPEELLTGVSGHYCPVVHGGSPVIRSLTFKTKRRTFGPFGVEEGTPFSYSVTGNQVIGMKGRSGWYLDSLALHLSPPKKGIIGKFQQTFKKITT